MSEFYELQFMTEAPGRSCIISDPAEVKRQRRVMEETLLDWCRKMATMLERREGLGWDGMELDLDYLAAWAKRVWTPTRTLLVKKSV